jgi:F-type H+-transporting ATPase subunit gamma
MASLRQIRQRMKAIHNIHGITKAMQMIAAFRFKKAEGRFSRSRAYFVEMEKLVANLSSAAADLKHPLFEKRKIQKKALVVITGDKGLCGAYNTNLMRAAAAWRAENRAVETFVVPVAKVGFELFRKRRIPTLLGYPEKALVDLPLAKKVTEELTALFLSGQVDSIEVLYAAYKAGTAGTVRTLPLLSLDYLVEGARSAENRVEYIYEPDFDTVFLSLVSRYLEGKLYMILLESLTSESSARMIAMQQATDNAEDVLDQLKLLRNKTRQATITRELSEIVGGANALV